MKNPRHDYRFNLHLDHFLRSIDSKAPGLEIGPFDLPMVTPNEGNCVYADYRSTAELKELASKLAGHNPDFVVPIEYELKNGYGVISKKFDWIAAAHTIEHIPDPIGWLNILADKLLPEGKIFLVVPDKRYTFDHARQVTQLSWLLEQYRLRITKPSYQQVFDHIYTTSTMFDPGLIWRGDIPPAPTRNFAEATSEAVRSLTEHVDVHCSVFTPESFSIAMTELSSSGIIPLAIMEMRTTQYNQMDFSVVLKRLN